MSEQMTSEAIRNAIFSRASEAGRSQLDWLDGLTIGNSGPEAAPVSPSPSPVKAKGRKTNATSGRFSSTSFEPVGPMSSWENKLRQRLERIGSTECRLT